MKSYFEEQGGTYTQIGDVLIPDLVMDPQPEGQISKYGRMRLRYLQEHRPGLYTRLILSGKLYEELLETQKAAQDRVEIITDKMAKAQNISEAMKAQDQMEWVCRMNSIRARAEEIILHEMIYV